MDLVPKQYKRRVAVRRGRRTPRLVKYRNNPMLKAIVVIAVLAFAGTKLFERFQSRSEYHAQQTAMERIQTEITELADEGARIYSELQSINETKVLLEKSEQEVALEQRLGAINVDLVERFRKMTERFERIPARFKVQHSVRGWYREAARTNIHRLLDRKEYDLATDCYNLAALTLNDEMTELRSAVKGEGVIEVLAGDDVYEMVLWPLQLDGLRLVPGDPVGRTKTFPYTSPVIEKGSYVLWVTRQDGGFSPIPVYLEHGEQKTVQLEVPPYLPEGMVFIPGGAFYAGGQGSDLYRLHKRDVDSFFIRKYEVTVGEYLKFWKSLDDDTLREAYRSRIRFSESQDVPLPVWDTDGNLTDERLRMEFPVVGISHEAAEAYCRWLSQTSGTPVRLPSADEWEKAARGVDQRVYPWGYAIDDEAHFALTLDNNKGRDEYPLWAPPGSFIYDKSVYSVFDMAGNVREMTATAYQGQDGIYQIKGGSASTPSEFMPCAHASAVSAVPSDVGFRYIMELTKESP